MARPSGRYCRNARARTCGAGGEAPDIRWQFAVSSSRHEGGPSAANRPDGYRPVRVGRARPCPTYRRHAVTAGNDAYLPELGFVYWVRTRIYWSDFTTKDLKEHRPVVVVEVPASAHGRIAIFTRTTKVRTPGVAHASVPELGLTKRGVFSRYATVAQELWTPADTRKVGPLDVVTFRKVLDRC